MDENLDATAERLGKGITEGVERSSRPAAPENTPAIEGERKVSMPIPDKADEQRRDKSGESTSVPVSPAPKGAPSTKRLSPRFLGMTDLEEGNGFCIVGAPQNPPSTEAGAGKIVTLLTPDMTDEELQAAIDPLG